MIVWAFMGKGTLMLQIQNLENTAMNIDSFLPCDLKLNNLEKKNQIITEKETSLNIK